MAGDGTVVEAAAGLASLVKQTALEQAAAQARQRAEAQPDNAGAQRTAATLEQAQQVLSERQQAREQVGKERPGGAGVHQRAGSNGAAAQGWAGAPQLQAVPAGA